MSPTKTPSPASTPDLTLAETLRALRSELEQAHLESANANILFKIDNVDVEFKVLVSDKTTGNGGIDFHIIKAGAELSNAQEKTHTIKLSLKVTDRFGKPVPVSGNTGHTKPSDD